MPAISTVYDWESVIPSFADALTRARRRKASTLVEQSQSVLDETIPVDMPSVRLAETKSKQFLELARVHDPAAYGSQLKVNHDVVIESMSDRIRRLTGRVVTIPAEFRHIVSKK